MERIVADLSVHNRADKDAQLALAHISAVSAATADKVCGVLVTRHQPSKYTVALSRDVPYGQTYELDLSP
jgi:hypothetical protein